MLSIRTSVLEIFYEDTGRRDGSPVLLLRGWPDAPRAWTRVADKLHEQGWRTIIPYLRGSSPTRFLSRDTPRFGAGVALAKDAIDLADALHLDRFALVGHDWGPCRLNHRWYQRLLLDGVGDFPHREAPERVADAAAHFFENHASR